MKLRALVPVPQMVAQDGDDCGGGVRQQQTDVVLPAQSDSSSSARMKARVKGAKIETLPLGILQHDATVAVPLA